MGDLLTVGHGVEGFGLALLIFGVLPGPVLRFLLAFYPKDHPRRAQIRGDFDAISEYWKRPFFVAETLELAVFEGLCQRVQQIDRWRLIEAVLVGFLPVGISYASVYAARGVVELIGLRGITTTVTIGVTVGLSVVFSHFYLKKLARAGRLRPHREIMP
jgi:hypothetical protein